jgi:predicted Zn-dependent protease
MSFDELSALAEQLDQHLNQIKPVYHKITVEEPIPISHKFEDELTMNFAEGGLALRLGPYAEKQIGLMDHLAQIEKKKNIKRHRLYVSDRRLIRYSFGSKPEDYTFIIGEGHIGKRSAMISNHSLRSKDNKEHLRLILAMHELGHIRFMLSHCKYQFPDDKYCCMALEVAHLKRKRPHHILEYLAAKYCDKRKAEVENFRFNPFYSPKRFL